MSAPIPPIKWGDLVEIRKGKTIFREQVMWSGDELWLPICRYYPSKAAADGWAVRVIESFDHTIPSEKGFYYDALGEMWAVNVLPDGNGSNRPYYYHRASDHSTLNPSFDIFPLTRAAAVTEVATDIRDWLLSGEYSWGTIDKDAEIILAINRRYGLKND